MRNHAAHTLHATSRAQSSRSAGSLLPGSGRPFSRLLGTLAIVAATAVLLPAAARPAAVGARASLTALQSAILTRINQIRVDHDLVPLRLNQSLSDAASQHSAEMLTNGYFAHSSVDGTRFWQRVQRYYDSSGFGYWSVGENLLWTANGLDAKGALDLWMASPEHRANILQPAWREIGIAAMYEVATPGAFDGSSVTLVTTDFGVRHE